MTSIAYTPKEIGTSKFKIAVYGLGHVGSAVASAWLRAGGHLIGVDKSPKIIENAKRGTTHLPEPGVSEAYTKGLRENHFQLYEDPVKASRDSVFKVICVPVLASDGSADLQAVKDVARSVGKGLKKGDIVSLNPSVPPGTTEDVMIPILKHESNLQVDEEFFVIYNPERIYEGRAIEDIEERYPAIAAGAGPNSLEIARKLLPKIFRKGVITMSSIRTAETEKLLEGVYRDVNIALANEMARFCEGIGVDFWEAREGANSQPFCHIHKPGAGVGGACIPVYPQFILHTADRMKLSCAITKMARQINDAMPQYCVEQATRLLEGKKMSSVSVLGLAFRGGVSDTRLSPTYKIIEELLRRDVKTIKVHDPLVKDDGALKQYNGSVSLTDSLAKAIAGAQLVILATDHAEYGNLNQNALGGIPVYDGRGILDRLKFNSPFAAIGRA